MWSDFLQQYESTLEAVMNFFMDYGYAGGFLISFLETVILPVFPDPFILGAGAVGLDPLVMAGMVIVGTLIGAIIGYWLARFLGHPAVVWLFGEKRVNAGEELFNKYGIWAVIVAGLTPIPFKIVVWLAGIFEMPFGRYLLATLIGRVPRFLIMAWLGGAAVRAFFS